MIQLLVDPAVNPACDLSRLAGNGTTELFSDTISFAGTATRNVSGRLINPDFDTLLFNGTAGTGTFVVTGSARGIAQDITRPQLAQAPAVDITNSIPGTPDEIVIRFTEAMGQVQLQAFTIAGVDCLADTNGNGILDDAVRFDPNDPSHPRGVFQRGVSTVTLLVDSTVNPTCDVSRLSGNGGTLSSSDSIVFATAGTLDVAGLQLNPNFDALLFNGTAGTGTFDPASSTGIPVDVTPPQVRRVTGTTTAMATITNSAPGTPDELVIEFDSPMQNVTLQTFMIASVDCLNAFNGSAGVPVVRLDPNDARHPNGVFQPGGSSIKLLVTAPSDQNDSFNAACDLSRLVGNGVNFSSSDRIVFNRFGTLDVAGNPLNPTFDTLLFNGPAVGATAPVTGTFVVTGSTIGIPRDITQPKLQSVATAGCTVATATAPFINPSMTLTFDERLNRFDSFFDPFTGRPIAAVNQVRIQGTICTDRFNVVNQRVDIVPITLSQIVHPFVPGDTTVRLVLNFDGGEDRNCNGVLNTEDANGNGVLDAGEDIGIPGIPGTVGNGVLDREDTNGNGRLDFDPCDPRLANVDRASEDTDGDGVLDAGEDTNFNGVLDDFAFDIIGLDSFRVQDTSFNFLSDLADTAIFNRATNVWDIGPQP
jgi:hypothetical protein